MRRRRSIHIHPLYGCKQPVRMGNESTLLTKDFKWMDGKELEKWRNYGCILEVDLEYISRGTARQAQRIPPLFGENEGQQGGQAYPKPQQQVKICLPPQDFKTMPKSRAKANQDTSGSKIRRRAMAGKVHQAQYGPPHQRYHGLREGLLQTEEQLGIRENDGKR